MTFHLHWSKEVAIWSLHTRLLTLNRQLWRRYKQKRLKCTLPQQHLFNIYKIGAARSFKTNAQMRNAAKTFPNKYLNILKASFINDVTHWRGPYGFKLRDIMAVTKYTIPNKVTSFMNEPQDAFSWADHRDRLRFILEHSRMDLIWTWKKDCEKMDIFMRRRCYGVDENNRETEEVRHVRVRVCERERYINIKDDSKTLKKGLKSETNTTKEK